MQKLLKFLMILSVFFLFSCSSSKSENDSDSIPDVDTDTQDSEIRDDDSDTQETEIVDNSDETSDADSDSDTDSEDEDWQRDIDIPEMSDDPYFEAYGDAGYNVAYYYYGDDPTPAKDPENVKTLWSKKCGLDMCAECEPKPYDLCAENYPFEPQIVDDSKNYASQKATTAGKFQCDALLSPGFWKTSDLIPSMMFNEFEGKVLFLLDHPKLSWQAGGAYVYDLNTRKVERLGRGYVDGWQNKKYYFVSTRDYKIDSINENSIYYGETNRHLLFYDKETNTYGTALKFSETPTGNVDVRASEKYVFMTAYFAENTSDVRILYTKIGEWDKWKELTYKKETLYGNSRRAGYPSMIGSLVTYFDYDIQVQVCDLNVGDSSCFQVSRADEYGRYPIFKDKNTVVYAAEDIKLHKDSLVIADISDKKNIKYKTIYEWPDLTAIQAADFEGDLMLFMRKYMKDEVSVKDTCFYNYKTEKVVCMDEDFDLEFQKDDGVLYKNLYIFRSVQDLVIRDLECYCDFYPNKCPLIEYKPNPENPKKPWGFDWKPENFRNVNNKKDGEKR
ncbi:hypothetical protein IJG44_08590 [bacterium]|nr:hypothetical protein [bacterium]